MAYQVFISHSTLDQKESDIIYDYLSIQGYKCFMDTRDLVPGIPFSQQLANAISDCSVFTLIFSKSADDSQPVVNECAMASGIKKPIIPARIQEYLPHNLAPFIAGIQWCDLFPPPLYKQVSKLLDAVKILVPDLSPPPKPDRLESDSSELVRILNTLPFVPEELIKFLMRDSKDWYLADKGVWEKYTLKQHSIMVLNQFEKYFSDRPLPGNVDRGFFRLILAVHDIGVPLAIETGDRALKFRYTSEIIEAILKRFNYKSQDIDLATALVSVDPIGAYIKSSTDRKSTDNHKYRVNKESYDAVVAMAAKCQMQVNIYFDLLLIYYMVDAGSYTTDAGGKTGLDWVFIFEPGKKSMRFSPNVQQAIDQFRRIINPGPGCMWVTDHDWHYTEYKYLKSWVKTPENMRKMDSEEVLRGHTFRYGKYQGKYEIRLGKDYNVAFYDPEN